jgi:hypothetical protein
MGAIADNLLELGHRCPRMGLALGLVFASGAASLNWAYTSAFDKATPLALWMLWVLAAIALLGTLAGYAREAGTWWHLRDARSVEKMLALAPDDFELLIAAAYRAQGYRVRVRGGQNDGGIDLFLYRGKEIIAVQCKRWGSSRVGAPHIREFIGAIADAPKVTGGIYVTTGNYTEQARQLAYRHGIELINGRSIAKLVGQP